MANMNYEVEQYCEYELSVADTSVAEILSKDSHFYNVSVACDNFVCFEFVNKCEYVERNGNDPEDPDCIDGFMDEDEVLDYIENLIGEFSVWYGNCESEEDVLRRAYEM